MDLLWAGRFIAHHRMQHPATLGPDEVAAFLTTLATRDRVSASTQNQALSALLFLYAHVIRQPLGALPVVIRVRTPPRLPVVLTRDEVRQVLRQLQGVPRLVAALLYGSGLRLLEALSPPGEGRRFGAPAKSPCVRARAARTARPRCPRR